MDYTALTQPAVNDVFQGTSCSDTCTDIADPACSCTGTGTYWSASIDASATDVLTWAITFNDGGLVPRNRANSNLVRAVRGGS